MADDKTTKTPGSITQPADNKDQRISEISNVNRAISNMQKQIDKKMSQIDRDISAGGDPGATQKSMNEVLKNLSSTVGEMGKGFSSIAYNLAKGSKDTLAQMGRAAQDDVKYDPQKMMAMAISKSAGPIMGYYLSRFMETDIFKSAAGRIRANISNAFSSIGGKIKGIFSSKARGEQKAKKAGAGLTITKKDRKKIPKMARGGVVGKGGLAQLHAAEVVMPVDKLLDRMDEQISISKTLAVHGAKWQTSSLAKMDTYIGEVRSQQKVGMFKGFLKALEEVQSQYEEPAEQRMLRSLLAIQSAIGAQIGTWEQVWQKMLVQNPTFRTMLYIGKTLKSTFSIPGKPVFGFFKGRGGYKAHLSKDKQPFKQMNENIGTLYTGTMYRLDAVSMYTRATAEATRHISTAMTGTKYKSLPGISQGMWSWFGKTRGLINALVGGTVSLGGRLGSALLPGDKKGREEKIRGFAGSLSKSRMSREVTKLGGLTIGKGRLEKIYGSQQAIEGAMSKEDVDKYKAQGLKSLMAGSKAIPVYIIGSAIQESTEKAATEERKEEKKKETKKRKLSRREKLYQKQMTKKRKQWQKKRDKISYLFEDKKRRREKAIAKAKKKEIRVQNKIAKAHIKEMKKQNAAVKRGKLWAGIKGGPAKVKNLFTSALGMFAGGGGAKAKGGIFAGIGNAVKSAFMGPKGIFKGMGKMMRGLGSGMKRMLFSGGFLKIAAIGVIGFLIYYISQKVGKWIDKVVGITDFFNKRMDDWHKKGSKAAKKEEIARTEAQKRQLKGGTSQSFEDKKMLELQGGLLTGTDEWQSDVGFTGRHHSVAVAAGQRKFQREHAGEYMLYSQAQINRARKKWLKGGGHGWLGKIAGTDPQKYGARREKAFLKYLKSPSSGEKPMSEESVQKRYRAFQKERGHTEGSYEDYDLLSDPNFAQRAMKKYNIRDENKALEAKTVEAIKQGELNAKQRKTNAKKAQQEAKKANREKALSEKAAAKAEEKRLLNAEVRGSNYAERTTGYGALAAQARHKAEREMASKKELAKKEAQKDVVKTRAQMNALEKSTKELVKSGEDSSKKSGIRVMQQTNVLNNAIQNQNSNSVNNGGGGYATGGGFGGDYVRESIKGEVDGD